MATALPGTGVPVSTDPITTLNGAAATASEVIQRVKLSTGAPGTATDVSSANPFPTMQPDITASGALAAVGNVVNLPLNGQSSAVIQITGTWVGTIMFEGTTGGVTFDPINGVFSASSLPATTATVNGSYRITPGALASIQARMTAFTSGSATIAIRASAGAGGTFANQVLPTKAFENGLVSTANSTAVALGIGGVFTGTAEDLTEYADVRVSVFADQASATDGLQMQQSSNGTNWDVVDSYTVPANTGKTYSVGVSARFFRMAYTNGATAQTIFRLQCKYHKTYSKGSSVRPQDARTNDNDMEEQLAHLMGYNGVSWDRLRSSTANGLVADVSRIVAALPAGANALGSVSVSNFPATQAVSGPLTDTQLRAAAVPVSVASQPLPTGASTEATLAALNGKVTAVNTGAVTISAALPTGANSIGTVQAPAITKGTQGATGFTTQDLKDAGRVNIAMTCYQAAGIITTEALFATTAFSFSRDGATATTGQQLAVTAGKRFRLQSIVVGIKNTAAAAGTSKLVLRYLAAGGAITNTSPILAIMDLGSNSVTANAYIGPTEMALPDGVELLPSSTFGFTNLSSAATMLHTITVNGYEF